MMVINLIVVLDVQTGMILMILKIYDYIITMPHTSPTCDSKYMVNNYARHITQLQIEQSLLHFLWTGMVHISKALRYPKALSNLATVRQVLCYSFIVVYNCDNLLFMYVWQS